MRQTKQNILLPAPNRERGRERKSSSRVSSATVHCTSSSYLNHFFTPINESWCVTVWGLGLGGLARVLRACRACSQAWGRGSRAEGTTRQPRSAFSVGPTVGCTCPWRSADRQVGAGVRGRGRLCVLDLWYGVDAVRVLTYSMLLVRRERLGYARTPSRTCRTWGIGDHGKLFFSVRIGAGSSRVRKKLGTYVSVA